MNSKKIRRELKLTEKDLSVIDIRGITLDKIKHQVEQLSAGTKYIHLNRACLVGDGITKIDEDEKPELINLQENFVKKNGVIKFVPASGAASRMFKKLESFMNSESSLNLTSEPKNDEEKYLIKFFKNLKKFAFYDLLEETIAKNGFDLQTLLSQGNLKLILEFLLTEKGLNYSNMPKALIKFHKYNAESSNALEEQVVESLRYIQDSNKKVELHFTVSPELKTNFENDLTRIKKKLGKNFSIEVSLSFQKKATDTIAVNLNGELFREGDELLFRPGGHGALIENLNDLDSDLIYVKNIDNVQLQENLDVTAEYKKLLGGLLIKYQSEIHSLLNKLDSLGAESIINEAEEFIRTKLNYSLSADFVQKNKEEKVSELRSFLNRPIRICGVVINEGHPGGGPFWVEESDGKITKQIVEGNQINLDDMEQRKIFESSTHFNPVDLVCGIKDYKGNKFDLTSYVDSDAVLVSQKSKDGKELKALELPGLWNGAMSDWITVFVEVPKETFTPVKEVNDLLLDYHQSSL